MFTAFYDESGTHEGSPITVLGGMVGNTEEWASFDREWKKVLAKYDLRFIRAKQLFHRQGPYRGWSQKQVRYIWADIFYVLQEHKNFHVSKIILQHDDYMRSYIGNGPVSKFERLDSKYALCARVALHSFPALYNKFQSNAALNFVLEAGHRNAGDALRVFSELKQSDGPNWKRSIGSMSFGTKEEFPALQAADLISYWFYKTEMVKRKINNNDPFEISPVERELANCGLAVTEYVVRPKDLRIVRQNYLSRRKRRTFGVVRAVLKAGEYLPDAWDTEYANDLVGVEILRERSAPQRDQKVFHSRRRR